MMIESNQNPLSVDSEPVTLQEKADVVQSVPDDKLPVKREAWGIVSEKDSASGEAKTVAEDQEEEEKEKTENIQENMPSSIKDSSEKSSRDPNSSGVPSSARFVDGGEKLKGQSSDKEQHQPSLKSQATDDVTATHEELPKKKRNRRRRKPKAFGNETASDTPEKPEEKCAGDRPNKAVVDQKGGQQKRYDDLKGDALKASPGAKKPRREHAERRQGEPQNLERGAESRNLDQKGGQQKSYDDLKGDALKASPGVKKPRRERAERRQGEPQNLERGAESRPRQGPKQKESPTKDSDNKGPKGNKDGARAGETENSPGGSSNESKGGNKNRGRRPPQPRAKSGGPVGENDDSRKRSNSTPEKRRSKNS